MNQMPDQWWCHSPREGPQGGGRGFWSMELMEILRDGGDAIGKLHL